MLRAVLHELVAEAALDAEVALGDVVVVRRGDVDDLVVLHVQLEVAADAAVRADRRDDVLVLGIPGAGDALVVLRLRHQRTGRADGDAVAAVHARRLGQLDIELGRDVGVEAAARDRDRERVLVVLAAGRDALVTEDALVVIAHVEVVVDLDLMLDARRLRAEAGRVRAVLLDVGERLRRGGEVDRRAEQLEHETAREPHPLRVGVHDHSFLGLARARRHKRARALDLDDAHAAHVHRRERVPVTQRRRLDAEHPAGIEDRRALEHAHRLPVDGQLDHLLRRGDGNGHAANTPRLVIADATAFAAVCPSPQIDASRITWATSASVASSSGCGRPAARRCSASSCRTVPTRHGTHCPHDSSRKNSAIRSSAATRSDCSSYTITTPEPSVTPAARVSSYVSGRSSSSGPTNAPAAPPSSTAFGAAEPASSSSERSVAPNGSSYRPGRSTQPETQNRRVPVDASVPTDANSSPPSATTSSTLKSVSTLFTAVGLPKSPTSTGNGGLLRGSPRKPSIDWKSAVSSPHTYAPAPMRSSISKPSLSSVVRSIAFCSRLCASGYSART